MLNLKLIVEVIGIVTTCISIIVTIVGIREAKRDRQQKSNRPRQR